MKLVDMEFTSITNTARKSMLVFIGAGMLAALAGCSRDEGNDPFLVPKTASFTVVSGVAQEVGGEQDMLSASIDSAARMLGAYAEGVKEMSQRKLDDAAITDSIRAGITEDPSLRDARIAVQTRAGVVTLEGRIGRESARERAMQIARAVTGVTFVNNRLIVEGQARNPVYTLAASHAATVRA